MNGSQMQSVHPFQIGLSYLTLSTNNQIWTASQGAASTALWIGNSQIATLNVANSWLQLQTFTLGIALSNSQAIAFGTGGSITFTDHTATIGTSSNYVATEYLNALTFEGTPAISTASGATTWTLISNTSRALFISDTVGVSYLTINTQNTTSGVAGFQIYGINSTITSAAGVQYYAARISPSTVFLTGTTTVNNMAGLALSILSPYVAQNTLPITVVTSSTLYIDGPPQNGGNVTFTNSLGIDCRGPISFDGTLNASIWTASQGTGSTTLYIGNRAITLVSDLRLKNILGESILNATSILKQLPVVRFTWNDPSDTAPVNRNTRGVWEFGGIAQEWIKYAPWLVNAPDRTCLTCLAGQKCEKHEGNWQIDYAYMLPMMVKGFQEEDSRITKIEKQIAVLQTELKNIKSVKTTKRKVY